MALALAEEIAVLKNRIALYESDSEAAKVNGNEAMQRLLLATITATRNNLLHLEQRLEKQRNRNQSAMSRGIKGTPFSSKLLGAKKQIQLMMIKEMMTGRVLAMMVQMRGGMSHPVSARDDFQTFLQSSPAPAPILVIFLNPLCSENGYDGKIVSHQLE
jgi:hypothetical protein